MTRRFAALLCVLVFGGFAFAQDAPALPEPAFANESYGPHERNIFDVWRAEGEGPRPLVIYFHGGGFRGGDKRTLNPALLQALLDDGINVAAVNYRLTDTAIYPAQMLDCARALQYIRHHADKYNIDPQRIAATGGSAGSGISQWLAFHDDLADPDSDDPIARESTRLVCAAVFAAQSTYDPRVIQEMFDTDKVHEALVQFFGMPSAAAITDSAFFPLFEDASAMTHLSADDPPLYLFYPQANQPLPPNSEGPVHIHHPKFGEVIKAKMDAMGLECVLKYREDYPNLDTNKAAPWIDMAAFLNTKLKQADSGKQTEGEKP